MITKVLTCSVAIGGGMVISVHSLQQSIYISSVASSPFSLTFAECAVTSSPYIITLLDISYVEGKFKIQLRFFLETS